MYEVIKNGTPYYAEPASSKRGELVAGTRFNLIKSAVVSGVPWVQIDGTLPDKWGGKWVRAMDVREVVETEPPPSTVAIPKPTPAGTFVLSMPDGGQVVNRDEIVWVEK